MSIIFTKDLFALFVPMLLTATAGLLCFFVTFLNTVSNNSILNSNSLIAVINYKKAIFISIKTKTGFEVEAIKVPAVCPGWKMKRRN